MRPSEFLARPREWLRRVSADMDTVRSTVFRVLMPFSVLGALNGVFGDVTAYFTDSRRLGLRVFFGVWATLHVPLCYLERKRPSLACLLYLSACFLILLVTFDSIEVSPSERFAFHATYGNALLLSALVLLPFATFVAFSTGILAVMLAWFILTFDFPKGGEAVSGTLPFVVYWIVGTAASGLIERFHSGMRRTQTKLSEHKARLEEEVAARTETIKQQQEMLAQSQKMEAIGSLAGGVAHDFNNLLTGIAGHASALKLTANPESEAHRSALAIERAAAQAAELTQQLLGFARKGKLRDAPLDVHEVIGEVVLILGRTINRRIELRQRLHAERSVTRGDRAQIQQVVMNLAVNAIDAMQSGGTLSIETEIATDAETKDQATGSHQGGFVRLSVIDTGTGIPGETIDKIFDPFFTTKPPGRGTGMGLAMVYGIVHNHGGAVRVRSTPGEGARFDVYLLLEGQNVRPSPSAGTGKPVFGSGTVLVADDEEGVRDALDLMLTKLGYDVALAENGEEAVRLYCKHAGDIDLVILDLTMPVMDGRQCFRALKEFDPDAKVLVATGHAADRAAQDLIDLGALGAIQKPFELVLLSRAVAEVLRSARNEPSR